MSLPIPLPKQKRSRATFERLLEAGIEVLSKKNFELATAAEIAAQAGFTVGAFYARFPSKDAMWVALVERASDTIEREFKSLDELDPKTHGLQESIDEIVEKMASMYIAHGKLALAIRRPANVRPDLESSIQKLNVGTLGRLNGILSKWSREVRRPNPKRAIEIALVMMAMTMREYLMTQDMSSTQRAVSAPVLAREIKTALSAYLTAQ